MKRVRAFPKLVSHNKKNESNTPSTIVFCEKSTGATRFYAESHSDPQFFVERLAGLLAMQCLARGSDPRDFTILVPADAALASRLATRATELLEEGRAAAGPEMLSPRQQEILQSVICNRANKEIASRLNITVRTVKFHISSLLTKFGVENRIELARRAANFLRPSANDAEPIRLDQRAERPHHAEFAPVSVGTELRAAQKSRNGRFGDRVLSA